VVTVVSWNSVTSKFLYDIERLVSSLPCGIPAFVTGDFNINILKKACITNKCIQLMNYYGFQQIITLPTHRRGGLLDNFYTNIGSDETSLSMSYKNLLVSVFGLL
jgi:hypothetical protein